jgi:hypothetical protein
MPEWAEMVALLVGVPFLVYILWGYLTGRHIGGD